MKRYLSVFLMIVICFVLQTTVCQSLRLSNIMPNLLVILTAVSGFMYGRKFGMYAGFLSGALLDLMYGGVVGICIFIFVLIGYCNGLANKLYFKEDLTIPLLAIGASDVAYGVLYYICSFLLRGRLDIISYIIQIIIPETIYTVLLGVILYRFMYWLEEKLYPEKEVPIKRNDHELYLK